MSELKKNSVHPLEIQGYTAEGAGVGRLEGLVVFVPGTIRGERWQVRLPPITTFPSGRCPGFSTSRSLFLSMVILPY